jgi:hypothetical protein
VKEGFGEEGSGWVGSDDDVLSLISAFVATACLPAYVSPPLLFLFLFSCLFLSSTIIFLLPFSN